jgi:leucyl/phenylalanyl-tRNA--protein transferase
MTKELALRDLYPFPDPRSAPGDAPLAWGGDLSPGRLLSAYSQGIFPWYDERSPILWWCPDPRFVLIPSELVASRRLRREARRAAWSVTFDSAFEQVIRACGASSRTGQRGTWITPEMVSAYCELHLLGFAHSVECWRDGRLAGGLYGVSLGSAYFGESMFFRAPNASKVAFLRLVPALVDHGFTLIDCQQETEHLGTFGARSIPRDEFLDRLASEVESETWRGSWASWV